MRRPLELGAHQRQRRAQLVGGVGQELPLPRGARLDPGQQVVEGVPEPGQLVVAALRDRQPPPGVVGPTSCGRAAVALHRVEGRAGRPVADERRGHQRHQVGDRELEQQLAQRLVVLAPADRGRHDPVALRGADRRGHDPVGAVGGRQEAADVEAGSPRRAAASVVRRRAAAGCRRLPATTRPRPSYTWKVSPGVSLGRRRSPVRTAARPPAGRRRGPGRAGGRARRTPASRRRPAASTSTTVIAAATATTSRVTIGRSPTSRCQSLIRAGPTVSRR